MKTIDQIKTELRSKEQVIADLRTKLEAEKRQMNNDELTSFETTETEIRNLKEELRSAEATARLSQMGLPGEPGAPEARELSKFNLGKALRHAATRSAGAIDGFEKEMQQEAEKEIREANAGISFNSNAVYVPMSVLRAVFSKEKRDIVSGTAANGGNAVATNLNGYVEALTEQSRILQLGTGYTTGITGIIDYVAENVVFEPTFLAEQGSATEPQPTFTKMTAAPKRLAGYIDVSNQWLAQTSPEFQAKLWAQMAAGFARAVDKAGILGGGSNEPQGIIANTSVGAFYAGGAAAIVTNANGAAPVFQDAVNAYKVVGNAKGLTDNSRHLMSYDLSAKLMNTKIDAGSGEMVLQNEMIIGRMAKASTHVPNNLVKGSSGSTLSAWIFGDFTRTEFFQWGGVEILFDPYTQAVTGTTRVHIASYVDFLVYNPGAFAVGKDFITT
jgi:HK97 family phage major capsid protein